MSEAKARYAELTRVAKEYFRDSKDGQLRKKKGKSGVRKDPEELRIFHVFRRRAEADLSPETEEELRAGSKLAAG